MPDAPVKSADVLIIGAGPAGIAAACAAAEAGASTLVLDDNPAPGGQIWRVGFHHPRHKPADSWLARMEKSGMRLVSSTQVVAAPAPNTLLVNRAGIMEELQYKKLILATGARELFLPFPGWTSPGIMGAGGLHTMVKGGIPIKGKRIIIAGSGPLLLAVAAPLKADGAKILLIAEQTDMAKLATFSAGLIASPGKLFQAIGLKSKLLGVPYKMRSWVTGVTRTGDTLQVTLSINGSPRIIECDYLACAFGLIPNLELPRLLRCAITAEGTVQADASQRTSQPDILAAGEITGIGGVEKSLAEGAVAGAIAAGAKADHLFAARNATARFAARLATAFALREEIKRLATPETLICRCEDVSLAQIKTCHSVRDAKLQTRCGMGACQGRICGPILRETLNWTDASIRPPIFSSPASALLKS